MNKKTINLAFVLAFVGLITLIFSSCQLKNPIMETWWDEPDREPIIEIITETVIEKVIEIHELLQHIDIIDVQFILFSGDQDLYNEDAKPPATTSLNAEQRTTNNLIISNAVTLLRNNPTYVAILHGHANPAGLDPDEAAELMVLSLARAQQVELQLFIRGISRNRMISTGYGGELNISGTHHVEASLNRRVELIIANITTEVITTR